MGGTIGLGRTRMERMDWRRTERKGGLGWDRLHSLKGPPTLIIIIIMGIEFVYSLCLIPFIRVLFEKTCRDPLFYGLIRGHFSYWSRLRFLYRIIGNDGMEMEKQRFSFVACRSPSVLRNG